MVVRGQGRAKGRRKGSVTAYDRTGKDNEEVRTLRGARQCVGKDSRPGGRAAQCGIGQRTMQIVWHRKGAGHGKAELKAMTSELCS